MEQNQPSRIGRSLLALLTGFVLVVVLSLTTDIVLHTAELLPSPGKPALEGVLALATVYRTLYGVAGSYVTARLAPRAPMAHAMIGGTIGLALSIVGAVATWRHPEQFRAHWYPVALIVLALPTAWTGGRIRIAQLSKLAADRI